MSDIDWRKACAELCSITYRRKHMELVLTKCLLLIYDLPLKKVEIMEYETDDREWDATVTLSSSRDVKASDVAEDVADFLNALHHNEWGRKLFSAVYISRARIDCQ